jgi:hypothetical protein
MRPEDVVRLKALEKENARLKRIVGEQALDIDMLREVARETSEPGAAAQSGELAPGSLRGLAAAGVPVNRPASLVAALPAPAGA